MKLILDSSVWIEQLRADALGPVLPRLRERYQLWMSGVVAAEILAGGRSRGERRILAGLLAPFRKAGRILAAHPEDLCSAGRALSRLREQGLTLKNPGAALLDAVIAMNAVRIGALLVSTNVDDFSKLHSVLPLRFEAWEGFRSGLVAP